MLIFFVRFHFCLSSFGKSFSYPMFSISLSLSFFRNPKFTIANLWCFQVWSACEQTFSVLCRSVFSVQEQSLPDLTHTNPPKNARRGPFQNVVNDATQAEAQAKYETSVDLNAHPLQTCGRVQCVLKKGRKKAEKCLRDKVRRNKKGSINSWRVSFKCVEHLANTGQWTNHLKTWKVAESLPGDCSEAVTGRVGRFLDALFPRHPAKGSLGWKIMAHLCTHHGHNWIGVWTQISPLNTWTHNNTQSLCKLPRLWNQ